jgi:hypothetical protein
MILVILTERWRKSQTEAGLNGDSTTHNCQFFGNTAERVVGVRAERGDGNNANDDDQREHAGILDCGGAVFSLEETNRASNNRFHDIAAPSQGG